MLESILSKWEYIGDTSELNTYVHPSILEIINKKEHQEINRFIKEHKNNVPSKYPGTTLYIKGNTYLYKVDVPKATKNNNHGHGFVFMSNGLSKIYRQRRKDKD